MGDDMNDSTEEQVPVTGADAGSAGGAGRRRPPAPVTIMAVVVAVGSGARAATGSGSGSSRLLSSIRYGVEWRPRAMRDDAARPAGHTGATTRVVRTSSTLPVTCQPPGLGRRTPLALTPIGL